MILYIEVKQTKHVTNMKLFQAPGIRIEQPRDLHCISTLLSHVCDHCVFFVFDV